MAQPRRTSKQSKQAGGTFLGIVLGLIVGLAIAVVVALYITHSPSPFVSKVAPPPAENTASQPQQFDPNRALQGKTPGVAVPQAAQPEPQNTAPGQSASPSQPGLLPEPQIVEVPGSPANNGVTAPPAPAEIAPKPALQKKTQPQPQPQPSDDSEEAPRPATPKPVQKPAPSPAPTVQKPAQKPEPQPAQAAAPKATSSASAANNAAKPPAADANTGYFLQVGAYKTETDAEQQRARLGFQGFESKVSKRDVSGVTYYRVRVGPFSKFEDMNSARQRLSDAGVDTAVIRFTKQ